MKKNFNLITLILFVLFLIIDSYIGSQILATDPSFLKYLSLSIMVGIPFIIILIFVDKRIKK